MCNYKLLGEHVVAKLVCWTPILEVLDQDQAVVNELCS